MSRAVGREEVLEPTSPLQDEEEHVHEDHEDETAGRPALKVAIVSLNEHPFEPRPETGAGRQQKDYVARLAVSIAHRGQDVTVHTVRPEMSVVGHHGVALEEIDPVARADASCADLLSAAKRHSDALLRSWTAERPDVVHAHGWRSGVAAQLAARELGVPVVQTFYGLAAATRELSTSPVPKDRRARLQVAAAVARSSDGVIALSSGDMEAVVRLGVGRARTRVVPQGIDPSRVPAAVPAPEAGGPLRVLALAAPLATDGLEELVWAVDRIREVELTIGWLGPEEGCPVYTTLLRARQVSVEPTSPEAVAALVAASDVVAALSGRDDHVELVLQAMASGRPVIGTHGGAVGDAVVDAVTGLLVRPDDRPQLLRAMRRLAANRCDVEAMGQAAHDRVATRYPWPRIAEESLAVLAQVAC